MEAEPLDLAARTPPVVRAAQGYGASVVFTDRTGRAWPMTAYQGFNPNLFAVAAHAVSGDKEDLPTVLVIQPTARYGTGNVLVALQGLDWGRPRPTPARSSSCGWPVPAPRPSTRRPRPRRSTGR